MAQRTLLILAAAMLLAPAALAGESKATVDESKVYYGDADNFEKPAVITITKVFEQISEYTEARKKGKDDPQYFILLEKANQKFFTALEKVAREEAKDLIAETGSVKSDKPVPDVTELVIKALPK